MTTSIGSHIFLSPTNIAQNRGAIVSLNLGTYNGQGLDNNFFSLLQVLESSNIFDKLDEEETKEMKTKLLREKISEITEQLDSAYDNGLALKVSKIIINI